MKTVQVWHHKDGDKLAIIEDPWWMTPYEELVSFLFCPCCGFSGWLSDKVDWIYMVFHHVYQYLIEITFKYEKTLLEVPIESGCAASKAIWGKHDFCWLDDCPVPIDE